MWKHKWITIFREITLPPPNFQMWIADGPHRAHVHLHRAIDFFNEWRKYERFVCASKRCFSIVQRHFAVGIKIITEWYRYNILVACRDIRLYCDIYFLETFCFEFWIYINDNNGIFRGLVSNFRFWCWKGNIPIGHRMKWK